VLVHSTYFVNFPDRLPSSNTTICVCASGGYIHFVDAVVVSEATLDLVKNLNSPAGVVSHAFASTASEQNILIDCTPCKLRTLSLAGTQWKDLAPGGAEAYKGVVTQIPSRLYFRSDSY
jgi:hypothetical protein